MDFGRILILIPLILLSFVSSNDSHSIIRMRTDLSDSYAGVRKIRVDDSLYCDSWRFVIEANDAGKWSTVPKRCLEFVKEYMTGGRYTSDSEIVADYAVAFAKTVNVSTNRKDAWVFDIDETLLSNLPYYRDNEYGSEPFDEASFDLWVDSSVAPALPASLRLYNELRKLNFTIFLLTGRTENQRTSTIENMLFAGYSGWEKLFLRGASDLGKLATVYKSEKRREIESAGYTIHGNSGDQWSDLTGFAVATRSFKLPNPMYYIA
uniref:Acid phosphatase n=1 Tax=Kalanchoe fedtschenkoi TaxID=63787 RepID=A0A7N0TI39_KALFE